MRLLGRKVFFGGYVFRVFDDVYEPAEDSFFFAENLKVEEGDVVVDVGTGCGILGVVAAERASLVVGVDVNPFAVRCARFNAELNGFSDRMLFLQSDLFAGIRAEEKFDLVLFNAPYLPSEDVVDGSWLDVAWEGGVGGRGVIDRFIDEVCGRLRLGGCVFLLQSSLCDVGETLRRFGACGLVGRVVAECDLPFFETLVLVRAEFK